MRKVLFLLAYLVISTPSWAQTLWKTYKPVRADLLGYSATYNEPTRELLTGSRHVGTVITTEGADSDLDSFRKQASLDVVGFGSKKMRLSNIKAKGKIYIDQIQGVGGLPPGVNIVYAGLRSDSVEIEFDKISDSSIKPDEVVDLISKLGVKVPIELLKIKFVDTIRFQAVGKVRTVIKSPNVYYSIQMASLKPTGIRDKWIKTFNNGNPNNQDSITLKAVLGQYKSKQVRTQRYKFQRDRTPITVWLEVEKDVNGIAQLYVKTSKDEATDKGYLLVPNVLNNTAWNVVKRQVGAFETQRTNFYKLVEVDIDAHRNKEGDIVIAESMLRYPERVLKPY